MKIKIAIFFIMFSITSYSQTKYEFFGALKLNGDDKTLITYRLVFTDVKGKVSGYSITDIGGEHETKNTIVGQYNSKTKEFSFNEDQITYTKSTFQRNSFCYVHYKGKLKLVEGVNKIEGDFNGLYKNGKKCINGTIVLINSEKVTQTAQKYNKKIQKSKKVDTNTKEKVNLVQMLDSMKVNNISKDQNLNVFVSSNKIQIEIWDAKTEDGDRINLYKNNTAILSDFEVKNKKKVIEITIDNETEVIKLEATSEGDRKPNTAMVRIIDGDQNIDFTTNLKKWENASIILNRK